MANKDLKEKFIDKITDEFYDYERDLLNESKETIFEMSYQTTVKEEIKDLLLADIDFYSNNDFKILNKTKHLLDIFYDDWLGWDSPLSSEIEDSFHETLLRIVNEESSKEKNER